MHVIYAAKLSEPDATLELADRGIELERVSDHQHPSRPACLIKEQASFSH
jgi:hypothetical protein